MSVDGDQALAYARSRHYYIPKNVQNPRRGSGTTATGQRERVPRRNGWQEDGLADLDRIPRQQYFLRTVARPRSTRPGQSHEAVRIARRGAEELRARRHPEAERAEGARAHVQRARTRQGRDADAAGRRDADADRTRRDVVADRCREGVIELADVLPARRRTAATRRCCAEQGQGARRQRLGTPGAASRPSTKFTAAGYHVPGPAEDADRSDYGNTQIRYAPGKFRGGYTRRPRSARSTSSQATRRSDTFGADVLVIVGPDYDTLEAPLRLDRRRTTDRRPPVTPRRVAPTSTHDHHHDHVPRATVDTRFVPVDPKTAARWSAARRSDARRVAGLRAAFLRRVWSPRSCSWSCSPSVAIGGAYAEAERKVAHGPEGRASTPSVLEAGRQLPADRLRLARVRRQREGRAALRQQADADRPALRHDHGRPRRRRRAPAFLVSFPRDLWVDDPGHRARQDQRRVQRRAAARDRDDRAATSTFRSATTSQVDFAGSATS